MLLWLCETELLELRCVLRSKRQRGGGGGSRDALALPVPQGPGHVVTGCVVTGVCCGAAESICVASANGKVCASARLISHITTQSP